MDPIDPAGASGEADVEADVIETHISWIFRTPDRAYKMMKPVRMPFLDQSDPAMRVVAARTEFELNRRIAPDVYLGLADVHEEGNLVDRMIVMRRLPDDRRLSRLADAPDFSDRLREVARTIAAFHSGRSPVQPAPMAARDAVRTNWEDNFSVIGQHVGTVIPEEDVERARALATAYLSGRGLLFEERIRDGFVRDGHGDLIADDIFCLDDGPRIIDCLAFADDWRIGDVLLDIAFLVMDVHRLAGPDHAARLLTWYQEFSGEHHPVSLAHHYIAYRAHVRTKVACLRHAQGDPTSAALARRHHDLVLEHLEAARIRMILVGGGPGTGKSTLAGGIADHFGYPVLATDEIRKDVTATPHTEHRYAAPGAGIYDDSTVDAVYDEQLREAALLLDRGQGVVLDGSWTRERHRRAARELAARHAAELVEIECVVDAASAKERIIGRLTRSSAMSDATPGVADHLRSLWEPWDQAMKVPTDQRPTVTLENSLARIDSLPLSVAGMD